MNILVIEDHRDIHDNLLEFFELRGHAVEGALDGLSGLHLAASKRFDAIILDIMLPGIDGNQICHSLRQYSKSEVAIVMLSARDELDDRLTGFKVGADDYITKPFAMSEVLARVEAIVSRRQRQDNRMMVVADLQFDLDTLEITRKGVARSQIIILEALLKLRQVCCDLRLVNQDMPVNSKQGTSGKLNSLMEMFEELLAEGRKILLFSQFTSMLSLIEEELKQRGIAYALLTGSTRDRRTPIHDFQSGKLPIFLISLKAGGTGLNLTAADTVIHYDPWWNPAAENQATDRAYRIGQDKPVFVYKMIARGTVEEKIQRLQREKSALASGVLDGRTTGDWKLRDEDLQALFAPLPAAPKKTRK